MATPTTTAGAPSSIGVSNLASALAALPPDELQQVYQQLRSLDAYLAAHPQTLQLLSRILRDVQAMLPPSPYQEILEAYEEQAFDIGSHWEQVGGYLWEAIDRFKREVGAPYNRSR